MATVTPPRYVVMMWFHDHWSASDWTDDHDAAVKTKDATNEHNPDFRCMVIDTERQVVVI